MERFDSAYFDAGVRRVGTDSVKWDGMLAQTGDRDMIPMWIADMDFRSAPAIRDALAGVLERGTWGYTLDGEADVAALCGFWARRHGVTINPDWVTMSPCVVTGLRQALRAATKPGDGVLVFTPVYQHFYESILLNDRVLVESPLSLDASGRYHMNLSDMEGKLAGGHVRAVMFCSPHNPCCRLWSPEELSAMAALCARYGATIICDEIHADFVFAPQAHTSMLKVPEAKGRCVVLCAASKTFNIAGLQQSAIICEDAALRERMRKDMEASGVKSGNAFALAATRAAYTDGDAWLDGLMDYLAGNRDAALAFIRERLPKLTVTPLEATYLMWIDCRALGLEQEELIARLLAAHVKVNDGTMFGERGRGFIRLNLGCPRAQLMKALERIAGALA